MSFNTAQKKHVRNVATSSKTRASGNQQARKEAIVAIIKDKKTVSVKDISRNITDCSEKTLQRELLSLVSEGVLKKEGERRWSTYSLV